MSARIRALREYKGLTQGQLAYKAGMSAAAISRIESGDRPGSQAVIIGRIAAALNTSIDYLLGRTNDPTRPVSDDQRDPDVHRMAEELSWIWANLKEIDPQAYHQLMSLIRSQTLFAAALKGIELEEGPLKKEAETLTTES